MVEHQPRLLGSRVRFPAGAFAIFSVSAKASLPISLPPFLSSFFLFLFLSFPLPFPSTFRLRFKFSFFALIPLVQRRFSYLLLLSSSDSKPLPLSSPNEDSSPEPILSESRPRSTPSIVVHTQSVRKERPWKKSTRSSE